MRRIGKSIKNVEQDLEAKDLAARSTLKENQVLKNSIRQRSKQRMLLEIFEGISR